ncbi:transcriptional regulator family: Fungal Specific TF [Trichoderma aggressivum f. europaeum]|uniref:Transcriptional regulator family: Fungal Specific TF n=1 Tax=Trichoderma aggressivum f. europaeum TaxID=173218 RepID=A0AAE1IE96_9HYPO|nr:transcriptional regulator family: Fungal Specific TF [Trichoderma aggressivum f. europaeum]
MVTRSSLACLPCRSRHVKCDGKRPSCTRCDESGRLCNYAKSRRGGLSRAALTRLRQLAAAESRLVSNLIPATGPPAIPETRPESGVGASLDAIVAGVTQDSMPERPDPILLVPPTAQPNNLGDDALVDLYYKNFHKLHPVVLPRRHLVRLCQAPENQPSLVPLVAVMRLIGHLYGFREWPCLLQDAVKVCFSKASQTDPFMVQCRILYSIALFWYGHKNEAKDEMETAARLALGLEMFRCQFATEQGGEDLVLRECWRRTWWMLYIVNGYYAGTVGMLEFAVIDVEATVELPCEEFEYELGEIPEPKTLEDFDCREFSMSNVSFSSFAYLIGAARCVASAAPMALGIAPEDASLHMIHTADSILDGWLLLLPSSSKQIMDKSGEIDELMFQAKLLIHV